MIQISIKDQKYSLKNEWQDIAIAEAIKIINLKLPDRVQKAMEAGGVGLSDFMDNSGMNYAWDVLQILANIPDNILKNTHAGDVLNIFSIVMPLVVDLYNVAPNTYQPKMIRSFQFQDETFYLPESKVFNSVLVPGTDLDSVTFVESANMIDAMQGMKEKGIEYLPVVIACYCRKEDETFDQFTTMQRAERFHGLPMSVAWEVFFFMQHSLTTLLKDTLDYFAQAAKPAKRETLTGVLSEYFRRGYTRRLRPDMQTGTRLN